MTPTLHSYLYLAEGDSPWAAFRAACTSGGTSPRWTEAGDDPGDWHSPPDAAGGLVLWTGDMWRAEPPPRPPLTLDSVVDGIFAAATSVGLGIDVEYELHAAYFSCGGRGIFLLRRIPQDPDVPPKWVIAVSRDGAPRIGHSEDAVVRRFPRTEVVPL